MSSACSFCDRPGESARARALAMLMGVVAAGGCTTSSTPPDAARGDSAARNAGVAGDASDDASELGDAGPACASIRIFNEDTSAHEDWETGESGEFLGVSFPASDDDERARAETILGHACDGSVCIVIAPKTAALTSEQLAVMCRVQAEMGPRYWSDRLPRPAIPV